MAWAAALIGLAAVGFGGRALVDLSERRIRFVSAVTHELRTPLTSLRLYLDLLTSGMIEDEQKQKEYLNTLANESERLHRLIENVLDFARLERRSVEAHTQPTNVGELLEEVRQTWADRCAADGRELVVISTLPPEQRVTTDPRMVAQVLGNLVDNARKYTRDAADGRIWVWAKPGERGTLLLEVEDRGPGVLGVRAGDDLPPVPPRQGRGHHRRRRRAGAGAGEALGRPARRHAELPRRRGRRRRLLPAGVAGEGVVSAVGGGVAVRPAGRTASRSRECANSPSAAGSGR